MGQKDGDFLFWSTLEPMVTFLGLKNQTSPLRTFFFDSPCIYHLTDIARIHAKIKVQPHPRFLLLVYFHNILSLL